MNAIQTNIDQSNSSISPSEKALSNRMSLSIGPRFQLSPKQSLLRENSSHCFQIDMHEYGLPSISQSSDHDGTNFILEEGNAFGFGLLIDNQSPGNLLSPLVRFDPIEYGSVTAKYQGEQLIFSEIMSSTKIYLTQNIQTQENIVKKIIQKDKLLNDLSHQFARQECSVHSQLNHESIIKLYEYAETPSEYQLYMEYADQTDYLSRKILDQLTPIKNEDKLKSWVINTLDALDYIHQQGIIHVDLKLENLLITSSDRQDEYPTAKLCDFGLCHLVDNSKLFEDSYFICFFKRQIFQQLLICFIGKSFMEIKCGTQGYIAPEQRDQSWIGPEIDMWSFGILLYEMAVAYKPTQIKNYRYNPSDDIPFWNPDWKKKDRQLQDLIKQCLKYDPNKRLTAEDALQHPWLND